MYVTFLFSQSIPLLSFRIEHFDDVVTVFTKMASLKKEIDSPRNVGPQNKEERSIGNQNPFLSLKHPDASSCVQNSEQLLCPSSATIAEADTKGRLWLHYVPSDIINYQWEKHSLKEKVGQIHTKNLFLDKHNELYYYTWTNKGLR